MVFTGRTHAIKRVQFGILGPDEIRNMSVTQNTNARERAVEMHVRECGFRNAFPVNEHKIPDYGTRVDPSMRYKSKWSARAAAANGPSRTDELLYHLTAQDRAAQAAGGGAGEGAPGAPGASPPGFASVAAAFDFEHHTGSDPALEMGVLKCILVRESLVSQLEVVAERHGHNPGDGGTLVRHPIFQGDGLLKDAQRWQAVSPAFQSHGSSSDL